MSSSTASSCATAISAAISTISLDIAWLPTSVRGKKCFSEIQALIEPIIKNNGLEAARKEVFGRLTDRFGKLIAKMAKEFDAIATPGGVSKDMRDGFEETEAQFSREFDRFLSDCSGSSRRNKKVAEISVALFLSHYIPPAA